MFVKKIQNERIFGFFDEHPIRKLTVIFRTALLENIAEMVNDKKIEGIADLRDETNREGMRMVIELKRDAVPDLVLNNLFKKTALQTTVSGNLLALVGEGKQPSRITLKDALKIFIDFRSAFFTFCMCI